MRYIRILCLLLVCASAHAQLKLGSNQSTRNVNSILEMESTTRGMLLPRVSLTSTTSYSPLSATIVAGFVVYNSNASVTAGSGSYPINSGGTGLYYWDGSGWVAVKAVDGLSKANNLSDLASTSTARENLGVAIGSDVQAYDTDLDDLADGTLSASKIGSGLDATKIGDGSVTSTEFQYINTLSSNAQTQIDGRQPLDSDLTTIAGLTATSGNFIYSVGSAWASRTPAQSLVNLGATTVGTNLFQLTNPSAIAFIRLNADNTVSTLDASSFRAAIGAGTGSGTTTSVAMSVPSFLSVSGSPITTSGTFSVSLSGTALPLANGGTGATDASTARTNLGLAIGSNVQAYDADLNTIAGLTATTDNFIVAVGSAWASRTPAQVKTTLAIAEPPTGGVMQWTTNSAPTGWLLCDGSAVSRSTYSALFAVVGTTYGSGNGSTTFNVPNLQGRVPVGKNSGTFFTLGGTGGAETHTLTTTEMPAHTHSYNDGFPSASAGWYAQGGGAYNIQTNTDTGKTTGSAGSGGAHNNLQPYIVLNYIIKI